MRAKTFWAKKIEKAGTFFEKKREQNNRKYKKTLALLTSEKQGTSTLFDKKDGAKSLSAKK